MTPAARRRSAAARALLAAVTAAAGIAGGAGCNIGKGTGEVKGSLHVTRCFGEEGDGTPKDLNKGTYSPDGELFNLNARFFVGEPVDSPSIEFFPNMLLIRVQHSGVRLEFADSVVIELIDLYEAGRCMSGRVDFATGAPDWEAAFCDRSSGEPRLLIGTESEMARAYLLLNKTCPPLEDLPASSPSPGFVGDAMGLCEGGTCPPVALCPGRGSWVTFSQLGGLAADSGALVQKRNFKVNYGERIVATSFHLELCDARTVSTVQQRRLPIPVPWIVGSVDGNFDFVLERGQAGQPFP